MTSEDLKQLELEINHIFESGANEIRILTMVKDFIDKRHATQREGWISVEDGLPENTNIVLVCGKGYDFEGISTSCYYESTNTWGIYAKDESPIHVTHWQPLPSPPKSNP